MQELGIYKHFIEILFYKKNTLNTQNVSKNVIDKHFVLMKENSFISLQKKISLKFEFTEFL